MDCEINLAMPLFKIMQEKKNQSFSTHFFSLFLSYWIYSTY